MFKRVFRFMLGNCISCGTKVEGKKFKIRYCCISCAVIDGALKRKTSVWK